MKRIDISLLAGIIVSVILSSFAGFGAKCGEIRDDLLRLHIIANSDSAEDQALKLEVRDALLESSGELFGSSGNKAEAERRISGELDKIKKIAEDELAARGYDYPVEVSAVNMYFGTRFYDSFIAPAGRYDAVRVVIGDGLGANWWCVMFPPMCVPAASEKSDLPVEAKLEALGSEPRYKPKFAVVELIEGIRDILRGGGETDWITE